MRAITLELTAFGPYLEKQTIHFDELGEESIFLITGPTGAGKTTIFDAICYALYGRASGSDRDQDSLRSHFASVDDPTKVKYRFSLHNQEYEIIRQPRQLKKKERGDGYTDEPAKATLYEMIDGKKELITARIKEVNETIETKLGFDYEQFCKMVLIPQGEFRKLISENSKERESILQKIFHTYFYEKITEELKLESKELKEKINHLDYNIQHEIAKINWKYHSNREEEHSLENNSIHFIIEKLREEIRLTKEKIADEEKQKSTQEQALINAQNQLNEGRIVEEKFKEQEQLKKDKTALSDQLDSIEQMKEQLQSAKRAQEIIPFEEQMRARKKEWIEQQNELQKQQEKITQINLDFENIRKHHEEEESLSDKREKLKEAINNMKQQLDQVNHYLELQDKAIQATNIKEKDKKQMDNAEKKLQETEKKLEGIEQKLGEEQDLTKDYYQEKDVLEKIKDKVKKLTDLFKENQYLNELRNNYQILKKQYIEKQEIVNQLKEAYEKAEDQQKLHYAAYIAQHLEYGSPCPVCGSMEHPNKAEQEHQSIQINIKQLKQKLQDEEQSFLALHQNFSDCKSKGQSQRATVNKLYKELEDTLPSLDQESISHLIKQLQNSIISHEINLKKLTQGLERIQTLKTQKMQYRQRIGDLKQTFDQYVNKYQRANDDAIKLNTQLDVLAKQLPQDINDVKRFKQQIADKENQLDHMVKRWEETKQKYQATYELLQKETTIVDQLVLFEKNKKTNYESQQLQFNDTMKAKGFASAEAYQKSKMPLEKQSVIEEEIQRFEHRMKQINLRLQELLLQTNNMTRPDLHQLSELVDTKQNQLQTINDHLYALKLKLTNDESILKHINRELKHQKELEEEYYMIGELAELAHGNNSLKLSFERYVLASFLDEILLQANIRLNQMTENRYQLMRSGQVAKRGAQSGLDLEVFDHHTGLKRSVKTLSGGEGFKAALSLALGLADVVQSHSGGVQLDTLFIDEGFGTLDEVSLQQAIDCLKSLQDSNRLLGIISHVPYLKNEIHAKLQITPSHKGSKLAFSFGQS
ncbi:MAG TPA: SMC family ATPase [Virgibacillus sp.]|nr:SMC family ATPase [Virgibacillus sp.]HLR66270.1 SMC family ATPase [Virgibacillus sp.]